ncbi:hypothetical protein ACS0H5_000002 [Campylobacter lari]
MNHGSKTKKEIDFKNAIRNPYVDKELKRQVTINLSGNVIDYFKEMAKKKRCSLSNFNQYFFK